MYGIRFRKLISQNDKRVIDRHKLSMSSSFQVIVLAFIGAIMLYRRRTVDKDYEEDPNDHTGIIPNKPLLRMP